MSRVSLGDVLRPTATKGPYWSAKVISGAKKPSGAARSATLPSRAATALAGGSLMAFQEAGWLTAKAAAQQERQRALRDIDTAKDHAMKEIAETSANLAVNLAGKVIRETIKPEKSQELVREALHRLGESSVSRN